MCACVSNIKARHGAGLGAVCAARAHVCAHDTRVVRRITASGRMATRPSPRRCMPPRRGAATTRGAPLDARQTPLECRGLPRLDFTFVREPMQRFFSGFAEYEWRRTAHPPRPPSLPATPPPLCSACSTAPPSCVLARRESGTPLHTAPQAGGPHAAPTRAERAVRAHRAVGRRLGGAAAPRREPARRCCAARPRGGGRLGGPAGRPRPPSAALRADPALILGVDRRLRAARDAGARRAGAAQIHF